MICFNEQENVGLLTYKRAVTILGFVWMIAVPISGAWSATKMEYVVDAVQNDVLAAICVLVLSSIVGLGVGSAVALVIAFFFAIGQQCGLVERSPSMRQRQINAQGRPNFFEGKDDKWQRN